MHGKQHSQVLDVAVVGAGYWGRNLIRNFIASPSWTLRDVIDTDSSVARRATETAPSVGTDRTLDGVLADPAIDAVAVATPVDSHFPIARMVLEAGKHCLVEKPLASSTIQSSELVALSRAKNLTLMTDHTFCYTAAVRHLGDMVESGEIGEIHYIDSVRINLGLIQPDIDVFWDLAPHDLSILDYVLPKDTAIVSISAMGADPLGIGKSTLGYLSLRLSNGALANVHVSWMSPVKIRQLIIGGSRKMVVWDDNRPAQRLSVYDSGVSVEQEPESRLRRLTGYRTGDMVAPALVESEALAAMVTEFAESIIASREPLTSGLRGHAVVKLLEAASESIDRGGVPIVIEQ